MGCNILGMLFHLDLPLLEVFFIYTIKMSQKSVFSLFGHIPFLQLVMGLPYSNKGEAKGHFLVMSPWVSLLESLDLEFCLRCSLQIPDRTTCSFSPAYCNSLATGLLIFLFHMVQART